MDGKANYNSMEFNCLMSKDLPLAQIQRNCPFDFYNFLPNNRQPLSLSALISEAYLA